MSDGPDHVTAIAPIADHTAGGNALLARALRTKPLVAALLAAFTDQVQDAENALWQLLVDTTLDAATGAALDQLGALLLEPRGAVADTPYRAVLRACVLARKSRGTAADLCAILALLVDPFSPAFTYAEGAGCVVLEPATALPVGGAVAVVPLRLAKAAGVRLQLIDPPVDVAWFTFADDGVLVGQADSVRGFSDDGNPTLGGPLVGVVV